MAARVVVSLEGRILAEEVLAKPVTVVGRHPDCDIVIEHPAVSTRHMLLRIVDRTVYAEDLASTNGVLVNGVATASQVLHHLDMIEVGRHKLHFFDDALLVGKVGDLETTVLTEYERTMLAAHVPEPAVAAPAPARRDDELSRTQAIRGDSLAGPAGGQEGPGTPPLLALREVGADPGAAVIALDRANTMVGEAGGDTALVVRRGRAYFLTRFSGRRAPRLNGLELGAGAHALAERDVIEVGGRAFEVFRPEAAPA